jgi:hypothetical protein
MKFFVSSLILISHLPSFSQNGDSISVEFLPDEIKVWNMPGISFGLEFYRDKNLQNHFGDSLNSSLGQMNKLIGLDYIVSVDHSIDLHLGFNYITPTNATVFDSLNYAMQGYSISIGSAFKAYENRNFQLPVHGGYRLGHMYLKEENMRMKNFFFDFYAEINPRVVLFDRLVLFGCATLNWDVSKQHWKSKTITPGSNLNFKHTNGSLQIGLAWKFESTSEKSYEEEEY